MKAGELLEKYPKAGKVVNDWFMNKMIKSLNTSTMGEEFKEYINTHSINNKHITLAIDANPHVLFDVFDNNDVFIQINISPSFSYSINEGEVMAGSWDTRKEAEYAAIESAFELLDKKL